MPRNITYSEKVIGGFQIAWGAFTLFVAIYGLKIFYDSGVTYFHLTLEKISIWKVLKNYHFGFVLAILSLVSGFLLILKKKAGWQLAIITSLVTTMIGAVNLIDFYYRPDKIKFNKITAILLDVTLITVFFLVSYILLLKPFRTKYNATKATWWTIIIIGGLLLVDKGILEIFN